jgi:hypothetical protein
LQELFLQTSIYVERVPIPARIGRVSKWMRKPLQMDVVRRAYMLWEVAGRPEGRDQEFYLQAERELQEALDRDKPDEETAQ